jgi:hypothetical protein
MCKELCGEDTIWNEEIAVFWRGRKYRQDALFEFASV